MEKFKEFYETDIEEQVIYDLLEDDEFSEELSEYLLDESDDELVLDEALSLIARKRKSNLMKRLSKKMQKSKERKMLKAPTKEEIIQKARKSVIAGIKKKLSGGKTDLSASEKEKIEKKLSTPKMKSKIDKLARKSLKRIKDAVLARKKAFKNKDNSEE